jgi:hypothetical protein
MATPSKKHSSRMVRRSRNIREALNLSVLAGGVPAWWDVSTESWTKDELEVLAEELIPGEGVGPVEAARAVLVGLIQYQIHKVGTWSWQWLITALQRVPETVFAEAAAGSPEADEFVGGLLAVPFGVRSRKTMRTMSGLVSVSCKIGRYLQKIQASGDSK